MIPLLLTIISHTSLADSAAQVLEDVPLPLSPEHSVRFTRSDCTADECQLKLELRHKKNGLITVNGGELFPGTVNRTGAISLRDNLQSSGWKMGGEAGEVVAFFPLTLDEKTNGVLVYRQWESDYTRRIYEVWKVDTGAKPALEKIEGTTSGVGGPYLNTAVIRKSVLKEPFKIAVLKQPLLTGLDGKKSSDDFDLDAKAWDVKARKLTPAKAGSPEAIALLVVIAGTFKTAPAAHTVLKKWFKAKCLEKDDGALVLPTNKLPLLKPRYFILGRVFFNQSEAEVFLKKIKKCQGAEEALVTRAY